MVNYRICDKCGGEMLSATIEKEFCYNGESIILKDLNVYKCEECENYIYTSEEAEMIERLMQTKRDK